MRLSKPFFSGRMWLGGLGWPRPGPGPAEEEEDDILTNRFMSPVLWKQEQAHFGLEQAGGGKEELYLWPPLSITPVTQTPFDPNIKIPWPL